MKLRSLAVLAVASAPLTLFAQAPGPNRISYPENWDKGVLYATVDRHDIKQYRELWTTKPAVDAVKAGKPIPHGTVLTLVQYKAKVDDKGVPLRGTDGRFQCHKPHAGQDFVISLARLSGTGPGAKVVAQKGPDTVAISEFTFGPEKLDVAKGSYVRWTNTDDSPHQVTVTSDNGVRSDVMLKGQTAFMKFDSPGVYEYICGLHPNMKGKVEVK